MHLYYAFFCRPLQGIYLLNETETKKTARVFRYRSYWN